MTDKNSPYPKFTLYMTPELEQLIQAVKHAHGQARDAYRQAEKNPKGGDHFSQENVDWLMSFERAEKDAKAALGRYVYRAYDDMIPDDL